MKYVSLVFIASFFIFLTVVGLKDCSKIEEPIKDIIFDTEPFDWTESVDHETWRNNFKVIE